MRPGISQWVAKKHMLKRVKSPVILDVGAFIGNTVGKYLELFPTAKIWAFEPEAEAFGKLCERFKGNDQVVPVPLAISSQDDREFLLHIGGNRGEMSSLHPRPDEEVTRRYYRHPLKKWQRVTTVTIDRFCAANSINRIHILKADIHGHELHALQGAVRMLESHRVLLVYMETFFVEMYHRSPMFWELCAFLDDFGYTLFDLYGIIRSYINRQIKMCDALWVSPEVRERILDKYPEEWLLKSLPNAMGAGEETVNAER